MVSSVLDLAPPVTCREPDWVDRRAYPFQSHHLALPQGRVHYVDEGEGEPVLFVHGSPTWSFEYRAAIRALRGSHRVLAPDLLGFGLSERPGATFAYTPEAHARVVEAFVQRLGLERFSLVVHDMGGPIALPLALDDPGRVRRLVVINSFMWPLDGDRSLARNAAFLASELGRVLYRHINAPLRVAMPGAFFDRARLTPELHRQYLAPFPDGAAREKVLWQLARALHTSRDHYAQLWRRRAALRGVPTLLVWGMQDPTFTPQHLRRWQRLLPDAQTLDIGDAGHWPHEERPHLVTRALQDFLSAPARAER